MQKETRSEKSGFCRAKKLITMEVLVSLPDKRCQKMVNGKRCNQLVHKDELCEKHYKERSLNTVGGSIVGAGIAGVLALGPVGILLASVVGGLAGWKLLNEDDDKKKED